MLFCATYGPAQLYSVDHRSRVRPGPTNEIPIVYLPDAVAVRILVAVHATRHAGAISNELHYAWSSDLNMDIIGTTFELAGDDTKLKYMHVLATSDLQTFVHSPVGEISYAEAHPATSSRVLLCQRSAGTQVVGVAAMMCCGPSLTRRVTARAQRR